MEEIDWRSSDQYPEQECECHCGGAWRSHAKYSAIVGGLRSRKPCPKCGQNDNLRRVSSDPETMTIGGEKK